MRKAIVCAAGVLALVLRGAGKASTAQGGEVLTVPRYHVCELRFKGPVCGPKDAPARDVQLTVAFLHEKTGRTVRVAGFWDGDGAGGRRGNVFWVRFMPPEIGLWRIVRTESNAGELRGQREGERIQCIGSSHHGLWRAEGRWYRRSSGAWQYIVGNTHYTFLSRHTAFGPAKSDPVEDIRRNARYFRKLRFSLFGGRYPDPVCKPFLDDAGRPTDDGRFSFRPNPQWFHSRVDPVIREGFGQDLICDLILCGPDTRQSRSTLKGDPRPFLSYVAARYGSYPHVWFCLCNEWNIKNPRYRAQEIRSAGTALKSFLPKPSPISVHGSPIDWERRLNGPWHDHVTIQAKIKRLDRAADIAERNGRIGGGKPVVNDENAYEGRGDGFSEQDVIEGCFGTFLGGGYPTTGEKYGSKLGQYFWGGFDPVAHAACDNLRYLREYIEGNIRFWRLRSQALATSPFEGAPGSSRVLAEAGREYVLGTNRRAEQIVVNLPPGLWRAVQVDIAGMRHKVLGEKVRGRFRFRVPASRAVLTHFKKIQRAR